MAEDTETHSQKKSKDRSDKRKRKHAEDANENHVSNKKPKSTSTTELENGVNRQTPGKISISSTEQTYPDATLTNGSHHHEANGISDKINTPSKKRKKSQPSEKVALKDDLPGPSYREPVLSSLSLRQTPEPSRSEAAETSVSGTPSKKSKPNGKAMKTPTKPPAKPQSPPLTPMEIDSDPTQAVQDTDEVPYIQRTLRTILSTASTTSEEPLSKSPFFRQATQLYLPLSPVTLSSALSGVCAEHLSPLLLKYHPPLHGVVLSYANPRFSASNSTTNDTGELQPLAVSVAEYATPMIWLDVDMLLFKPARGHTVEGLIVLQSESHIGLQVYNLFSGRIRRSRLPQTWKWISSEKTGKRRAHKGKLKGGRDEDGVSTQQTQQHRKEIDVGNGHDDSGYWSDETGAKVTGLLKFWVWEVEIALGGREAERNLPTIEGTMVEESLQDEEGTGESLQKRRGLKEGKRKG